MSDRFHTSQPIDCGGLKINGTEVITSAGAITADIQATAGSIDTAELADDAITAAKIDDGAVGSAAIADSVLKVDKVTLTADEIVGTDAGDIGHASGATLVAAPGAGKVLEFVSAVLSYTHDTADYTGGGDDNVIQLGTTTVSPAIAGADLLEASGDKIAQVTALGDADVALTANSTLNLHGTALTQPGTAAGTLDVFITYRVHTL
jgi:hypothetical protein